MSVELGRGFPRHATRTDTIERQGGRRMGVEATGPGLQDIPAHLGEQTSPSHDGAFLPTSAHKPMMHGDMDRK